MLIGMYRILAIFLTFAPLCAGQDDLLTKYFVAFLYKGPKFAGASVESLERKVNHEKHIAYIERMTKEGKLLIYGPILGGGDLRGMYVFKAGSIEEARSWANSEPSVKIGMMGMRVYPWLGPSSLAARQKAIQAAEERR
jgi:uncharacterized protein YciI